MSRLRPKCSGGNEIDFDVPTVTGTENLLMAAVLAQGRTVLRNAAREPEIVALAETLRAMGADIQGAGTAEITIQGVPELRPVETRIIPDRIEAGTFMVAAALTGGDIQVAGCNPAHLGAVFHKLRQAGAEVQPGEETVRRSGGRTSFKAWISKRPLTRGFPPTCRPSSWC